LYQIGKIESLEHCSSSESNTTGKRPLIIHTIPLTWTAYQSTEEIWPSNQEPWGSEDRDKEAQITNGIRLNEETRPINQNLKIESTFIQINKNIRLT